MPYTIVRVETTPNPAARKLIVDPCPGSIRSYFKAEDAGDDELAAALFGVPGVTNVLIHTGFISVCAEPGVDWKKLTRDLKSALGAVDAG